MENIEDVNNDGTEESYNESVDEIENTADTVKYINISDNIDSDNQFKSQSSQ